MKRSAPLVAIVALLAAGPALGQDTAAAEASMKKSGCLRCHSVSAKKVGPSFKETAAKYKGQADAEKKLTAHLTTNPRIKSAGGAEETHPSLNTKDAAEVKSVVAYILSR